MAALPDHLLTAISRLHARLPVVHKTHENDYHGNKYADLADITKAMLPVLHECGLLWTTTPVIEHGTLVLRCELTHIASGEAKTGDWPLPIGAKPQDLGAAATYARRHAFCAMTNLVADEDTDGEVQPDPIDRARETLAEGGITGTEINGQVPGEEAGAAVLRLQALVTEHGWSMAKVSNRFKALKGYRVKQETDPKVIDQFAQTMLAVPDGELASEKQAEGAQS